MLEMDTKGNLYLYKSALLCKNEIIKRLTEGNYHLAEPSTLGINFTNFRFKTNTQILPSLPGFSGWYPWSGWNGEGGGDDVLRSPVFNRVVF